MLNLKTAARAAATAAAVLTLTFGIAACAPSEPQAEPSEPTSTTEPADAPETAEPTEPAEEPSTVPDGTYYAIEWPTDTTVYQEWTFEGTKVSYDNIDCTSAAKSDTGEIVNGHIEWRGDYTQTHAITLNADGTVTLKGLYEPTVIAAKGSPQADDYVARYVASNPDCGL